MSRPYLKTPLSLSAQVSRLQARGLHVDDAARAESVLRRIDYYRLSPYWRIFKNPDDTFREGCSFDLAVERYEFDRRLRLICLDIIERIEITIRCEITCRLATSAGVFAHEDRNQFTPRFAHSKWLDKLHKQTEGSKELFVRHYRSTYEGFPTLPIWTACELLSFGGLSHLFKGLETSHRQAISHRYRLPHAVMASWLHTISYVRNICAHHGRLWNRMLAVAPMRPKKAPQFAEAQIPSAKRVYIMLCVLRRLSRNDPASDQWVDDLAGVLGSMDVRSQFYMMGIPEGWRESALWRPKRSAQ